MKKQRGRGTPASLSREPAGQLQAGEVGGASKSAEPGLRETPGLWEATFDAITDLVSIIDKDFRLIKVNKAFAQALKKTPEELLGGKCYEMIHSSTEPWMSCPHKHALQSAKSVTEEFWEPHLEKYVQVSVSPLLNRKNEMIGSVHIIKDITNRKNAEDTLRQSEERFRLTFDQSPIGAALLDAKDGHFARTNGAFCRFTGYSKEELTQLTFRDITYPDDLALSLEQTRLLLAGEIDRFEMEKRYVRKGGSTAWGHLSVQVVTDRSGRILYTLATIQDITERREAEEALKRSEEAALRLAHKTGAIAEIGRIISSSLDIEEVYERFAEEVRKLIPFDRILVNLANKQEGTLTTAYIAGMEVAGTKKGVVFPVGETVTDELMRTGAPVIFHPESIEEVRSRFPGLILAFQAGLRSRLSVPLIARGEVIGSLALWSQQPKAYGDRDIRLAQSVASQIAGAIANAQLFRERKRIEEALRESEESYRSLVETSPDAIFLHEEGTLVYLNPAAVRLFGAGSAEELYGKNAFNIVHPDDRKVVQDRTDFIMTTGVSPPLNEIRILRHDGSTVDVEATAGVSYYRGKK